MFNQNNQGFMQSKGINVETDHSGGRLGVIGRTLWLVWVGQKMPGIISRFEPRPMGEGEMSGWHAWSRQISLVSQATSLLIVAWNSSAGFQGYNMSAGTHIAHIYFPPVSWHTCSGKTYMLA